jgi:2-octaprenylphenol hydroxylase
MAMEDAAFAQAMAMACEHRLGSLEVIDRRVMFPLIQRHAVTYVRGSIVLAGDAAHSIHPLAGQGINLGFMDVATLAEELSAGLQRGLPFAHDSVLRRYQRRRKSANMAMMATMEAFRRGYGRSHWALQLARNWGMSQADRHGILKQWIVEHAMGLRGDVPGIAGRVQRVSL